MTPDAARVSWGRFQAADPALAAVAERLLRHDGSGAIGFLATVSRSGIPHLAPVSPFFCADALCLCVGGSTPKRSDLDDNGRYVLHAFLGRRDTELKVLGWAERVDDTEARRHIQAAIPFPAFKRDDPVYRLWLAAVMHACWENAGTRDTYCVRRWWRPG